MPELSAPQEKLDRAAIEQIVAQYMNEHPPEGGKPPTDAQVMAVARPLIEDWLASHPAKDGQNATPDMVAQAAADFLTAHPPQKGDRGQDASQEDVAAAVTAYLTANPPAAGANATPAMVADAVATYLAAHPPQKGDKGDNATSAQIASAVTTYLQSNPPAPGPGPTAQQIATAVAAYLQANPPAKGDTGPAGQTLIRQINVSDSAQLLAIGSGMSDKRYACAGTKVGDRLLGFIRSYRLNGVGQPILGRPAFYWLIALDCQVDDTVNVVIQRPGIALLGGGYELSTDIVRVNGHPEAKAGRRERVNPRLEFVR